MGMPAILINGAEPFEQMFNILSTEDHMLNLVTIGQTVSENTFIDYMILYMYLAQRQGQIHRGTKFWL